MRPLESIRILDLSRLLPGPFATMILADLGATVDKVEAPDVVDAFPLLNRGKRSLVMNLKASGAADAFKRLAAAYDVVFDSLRPGVMDRLGIGHQSLCDANPRLIVCALTGYGQSGPLARRAGHDLNYVARAGHLGCAGRGAPVPPSVQVADIGGALFSVIGILAALRERDRTGCGTILDVAMTDAAIPFATAALSTWFDAHPKPYSEEMLTGELAAYNTYATSDGGFVALAALEEKFLRRFCEGAGIEFDAKALVPGPHQTAIEEAYRKLFASKTHAEWTQFSDQHDCCLEPVLGPADLFADPHLRARGVWIDGPTGVASYRTPVTPRDIPLSKATDGAMPSGAHSDAVLAGAGFSIEDIATLRQAGVIAER